MLRPCIENLTQLIYTVPLQRSHLYKQVLVVVTDSDYIESDVYLPMRACEIVAGTTKLLRMNITALVCTCRSAIDVQVCGVKLYLLRGIG